MEDLELELHLVASEMMLPYMFAAHKHNYSRYGLYYVRSMTWLNHYIFVVVSKVCITQLVYLMVNGHLYVHRDHLYV